MRQAVHEFTVPTRGKGMYEFTREVRVWIETSGIQTGLLTLHVRHTSASILVQENADPQVQADFEAYMSRLVRDGDAIFEHTVEGPDDMAAHVLTTSPTSRMQTTEPSETLPSFRRPSHIPSAMTPKTTKNGSPCRNWNSVDTGLRPGWSGSHSETRGDTWRCPRPGPCAPRAGSEDSSWERRGTTRPS